MALGIWWRVGEVPQLNDPFDVAAFTKTLPTPEQNVAGRKIGTLLTAFPESRLRTGVVPGSPEAQEWNRWWDHYKRAQQAVIDRAWPADNPELNQWMNELLAQPWFADLRSAVKLPPGQN